MTNGVATVPEGSERASLRSKTGAWPAAVLRLAPMLGLALVLGGCGSTGALSAGNSASALDSSALEPAASPLASNGPTVAAPAATPSLDSPSATIAAGSAAPRGAVTVGLRSFFFTPNALTVHAGTAVFYLANRDAPDKFTPQSHDFVIEVNGTLVAAAPALVPGQTEVLTLTGLQPGTYQFFCSIGNHRQQGMVGTLTVTP